MSKRQVKTPGLAPGTLSPPPGAQPVEGLEIMHYTADDLQEVRLGSVETVRKLRKKTGVTWINLNGLGNVRLLEELGTLLEIHPLALEDCLSVRQRPKVDDYDSHLYIVLRMLHYEHGVETEQISILLGDGWVVTVQERPGDCLDAVRERLRRGVGQLRQRDSSYLMYAIVDAIIDHYFPFLERLGEHVEALEEDVLRTPTPAILGQARDIKRSLLEVRRAVWPLRDAVNVLVRDDSPLLSDVAKVYLRDCYDHTVRVLDIIETDRELAGGLMDVYMSSVSNKMNEVMKVLTIIATIFIPLTFVAGIYGMNFEVMPELKWRYGYLVVWTVMVAIAVFMLIMFRRIGWLGGRISLPPKENDDSR